MRAARRRPRPLDQEEGTGERTIHVTGILASCDGRIVLRHEVTDGDPLSAGRSVASFLLDCAGGSHLLEDDNE